LEILEGLFSVISRSNYDNWWMAKALDLETSLFSFPGLITEYYWPFTGDSHGDPGDDRREMFWFTCGDSVSDDSSYRGTFIGLIRQFDDSIFYERSSGDIEWSLPSFI